MRITSSYRIKILRLEVELKKSYGSVKLIEAIPLTMFLIPIHIFFILGKNLYKSLKLFLQSSMFAK